MTEQERLAEQQRIDQQNASGQPVVRDAYGNPIPQQSVPAGQQSPVAAGYQQNVAPFGLPNAGNQPNVPGTRDSFGRQIDASQNDLHLGGLKSLLATCNAETDPALVTKIEAEIEKIEARHRKYGVPSQQNAAYPSNVGGQPNVVGQQNVARDAYGNPVK